MNEYETFPDFPEPPQGLSLSESRRFVNEWGAKVNAWRHHQYLADEVEWVEWLGGVENECQACKAASGVMMRTHEINLEAHLAACTCEEGCACILIAVLGPELEKAAPPLC